MRMATNSCYDELRRRQRHPTTPLEPVDRRRRRRHGLSALDGRRHAPDPETSLERRQLEQAIQHCLEGLPEDFRAVIVMVDLEGLDYQEVAEAVHSPLGTIKSRVARARMRLRDCLSQFRELLPSFARQEGERERMIPQITPDELHMLSAYLDGQLTPAEIRQAEELLASRFEMRTALDELSQTRALLRSLPMRRAPRNFTLSPAMALKRRLNPLAAVMRWSSAFATAAAVVVLALGQLGGLLGGAGAPLPAAAPVMMENYSEAEAQAADSMEATAPVIVWGEPGEQVLGIGGGGAGGMGGGDGSDIQPAYPEATAAAAAETGMMPQPTPTAVEEVPRRRWKPRLRLKLHQRSPRPGNWACTPSRPRWLRSPQRRPSR